MVHTESFKVVGDVALVEGEEGFVWLEVQVVTMGNVRKVVRIPHYFADSLRSRIASQIDLMEDDARRASWGRCIEWFKSLRSA